MALWADVMEELHRRGIIRTANNPVGDYAETLVATATRGRLQPSSTAECDVLGPAGERIQVKTRRKTPHARVNHFSGILNLERHGFDFVVGIVFNHDFTIDQAWRFSWEAVRANATFQKHTNSWRLRIPGENAAAPGIVPVTLVPGGVL